MPRRWGIWTGGEQQGDRARRLTPEDRDAIRSLAETRSLRELAGDFGLSHETVRSIRQSAGKSTRV